MRLQVQFIYFLNFIALLFLFLSCTSFHTRQFAKQGFTSTSTSFVRKHEPPSTVVKEEEKALGYQDLVLSNLPSEMHYKIEQWLLWFQGDGCEQMSTYLSRSSRYIPLMQEILSQYHLPKDLVYVALIESGFSSSAVSRARAVGFWQFIRGTASRYKLTMNSHIDERRDAVLATHAAAKYFKGLYSLFGSWHLAMAAYNVGENRVKNELLRHHTRHFWELVQKGNIPAETANYVPKFFAAMIIAKNPKKYGFEDVEYEPAMTFEEVSIPHAVHLRRLAVKMDLDYQALRRLNPKFLTSIAMSHRGEPLLLRVPEGTSEKAKMHLAQVKVKAPRILRNHRYYRVRRGDALSTIAQRFRVPLSHLKHANGLRRSFIRIGQRLKIPYHPRASKPYRRKLRANANASEKVHIVRRGDTLSTIALKYRVSLNAIVRRNRLRNYSKIFAGSRLIIPR